MKLLTKIITASVVFTLLLCSFTGFIVYDSMFSSHLDSISALDLGTKAPLTAAPGTAVNSTATGDNEPDYPVIGDNYYNDGNVELSITTKTVVNSNNIENRVFIVDIRLSDIRYLKTAISAERLATSAMAEENNAIFAINGDFFEFRSRGFVIRNGEAYRDTPRTKKDGGIYDALVVGADGTLSVVDERAVTLKSLYENNAWQVFTFGPGLIENGEIAVSVNDEVDQAMSGNPRTAIGMIEPLHYIIVVSEGRLVKKGGSYADGLSLYELARVFEDEGCTVAYNLDGGSSTTLYFNGKVINTIGENKGERLISDIIYFSRS